MLLFIAVGDNKSDLAGNSLFAVYGGESFARSDRTSLADHLDLQVKNVSGNYLSAELSLVDAAEETDLALELGF